ncbi:FtsW/RodA/SpoVE family cell cycle protein [bacterium]|nr:FtsW/RodA/SpoVE family cell cycle protein [bacterium]
MGYLLRHIESRARLFLDIGVLALAFFGTVFVISAEWYYVYLKSFNQFLYLILGIILFYAVSSIPYSFWARISWLLYFFSLGFLLLPILFHGGRWIHIGSISIQPYEFAKIAIVLFLASFLRKANNSRNSWRSIILTLFFLSFPVAILIKQPHFGACVILILTAGVMLFLAGVKIRHLIITSLIALLALGMLLPLEGYRIKRLRSAYGGNELAEGYQKRQALIAIGSGGIFGKGFLGSVMKFGYLPEAHSDFLFAVTAEESGLFFSLLFFFCPFILLFLSGFSISFSSPNPLASLIAGGLTSIIAIQALLNLSMVSVKFVPVIGIPLPFFAHGGSSLISSFIATGIIRNIALQKEAITSQEKKSP